MWKNAQTLEPVYNSFNEPGNKLEGINVALRQTSWCSPTSGQHQTTCGAGGKFYFPGYIYDPDSTWLKVELGRHGSARQFIGGLGRPFCHCPPIETMLKPTKHVFFTKEILEK
jgi:hypothetical protein